VFFERSPDCTLSGLISSLTHKARAWNLYPVLGVLAVALTRILFRSHLLYDLDSVNFALGILRFDPASHQPHPPGYFLYVCLARLVNRLLADPNAALVAISIAASCGAVWVIYLLTKEWFDDRAARISMVLFLCSPLGWFHGIVALTYMVEGFFSALVGYLCWRAYSGNVKFAIPAAITLGIAAGFRPSIALMLAPLWLLSLWHVRGICRWLAVIAAVLVTLLWFIPMAEAAGGVRQYLQSFQHLWSTVAGRRTALSSAWLPVARFITIGWILILCFGSASLLLLQPEAPGAPTPSRRRFLWFWLTPGMLFFTFVFLNYVNSGYLLVLCPPGFALLAGRGSQFLTAAPGRWIGRSAFAAGVVANCLVFAFAPLYCSLRGVREFERDMQAIRSDFHGVSPDRTLLIGFDSHYLGYRHAGYYLPGFVTVQYPEVQYPEGKRVFVMHNRDTQVVDRLSIRQFDRFILFPLPVGSEYSLYLSTIREKLPKDALHLTTVGREQVLTGPASVIPLLFPFTTMYTPLHQSY